MGISVIKKLFYALTACAAIAVAGLIGCTIYALDYYEAPGPLPQASTVIFKRGEGFRGIVDDLSTQGVIHDPLLFKAIAVALGDARKFKAGEYYFPAAISPSVLMNMIAHGQIVVHKFTVPEGLTVREIVDLLKDEQALDGDAPADIKEGSLLPETYNYTYGDKRKDIIERMQNSMSALLDKLWKAREPGLPFDTSQQALTMASIVEKETGVDSEREHVASVFINRLRKGMKLQSDPTVAYGLGKSGEGLTIDDLRQPTPYNTYTIPGLPPGPISNPGRAALEAVFNPAHTDDLYFVATGTGGHNFASTLKEHNENVQAYREKMAVQ